MRMRPTRPPPTVARRCPSRASRSRRSCCGGTRLAPRSSRPAGRAQPRHAPPCGSPAVAQAARRPSKRGPGARRRCPHPVAPSQPTAERTVIFEHLRVACLNFVQVADDRREYSPDIHPPVPCIISARLSCSVYSLPSFVLTPSRHVFRGRPEPRRPRYRPGRRPASAIYNRAVCCAACSCIGTSCGGCAPQGDGSTGTGERDAPAGGSGSAR